MAIPVDFEGSNRLFHGGDRENIQAIYAYNNGVYTMTRWSLTAEERAEVARTGLVSMVQLAGDGMIPAYVGSDRTAKEAMLDFGPPWPRQVDQALEVAA